MPGEPELVVFSHLRWAWVWQRPQHVISRVAKNRRTWFVEEPLASDVPESRFRYEDHGPVTRVWLEVPRRPLKLPADYVGTVLEEVNVSFDDDRAEGYGDDLTGMLGEGDARVAWLYTPLALGLARALRPRLVVYDVMDDLGSFNFFAESIRNAYRDALASAGVVFTGGRSLHRSVTRFRSDGTYLFPSGVEPEHYEPARSYRPPRERPVAGYVGVIDERLDRALIGDLATELPDWEIQMVGPIIKIHPDDVPQAPNLVYPGMRAYDQLPEVMGGFDVGLMPFALNEATRSISPTKTLEYLAAGLHVVSTRVPDVVSEFGDVVHLREDAAGFAEACRSVLNLPPPEQDEKVRSLLHRHHWDTIASRMEQLVEEALGRPAW